MGKRLSISAGEHASESIERRVRAVRQIDIEEPERIVGDDEEVVGTIAGNFYLQQYFTIFTLAYQAQEGPAAKAEEAARAVEAATSVSVSEQGRRYRTYVALRKKARPLMLYYQAVENLFWLEVGKYLPEVYFCADPVVNAQWAITDAESFFNDLLSEEEDSEPSPDIPMQGQRRNLN